MSNLQLSGLISEWDTSRRACLKRYSALMGRSICAKDSTNADGTISNAVYAKGGGLLRCRSRVVAGRNSAVNCAEAISTPLIEAVSIAYSE